MISAIFWLAEEVLTLYTWAVIISAILMTLSSFGVLDTRNRIVWTISDFFYRITEPALKPIRRFMPDLGGIDISPLILILLLQAAKMALAAIFQAIVLDSLRPLLL